MQVDLTNTQLMMLRSLVAGKKNVLARRRPNPEKMGALSTLAIEQAAVNELDTILDTAMNGERF